MQGAPSHPAWSVTTTQVISLWFYRVVAVICLVFGLAYWVRLIGFYDGAAWRFDLMPVHWQVASATLAVLFPFAACGLWMLASWGAVIWLMCALAETVMHAGFPELFGRRDMTILSHAMIAALYVALRVTLAVQGREAGR